MDGFWYEWIARLFGQGIRKYLLGCISGAIMSVHLFVASVVRWSQSNSIQLRDFCCTCRFTFKYPEIYAPMSALLLLLLANIRWPPGQLMRPTRSYVYPMVIPRKPRKIGPAKVTTEHEVWIRVRGRNYRRQISL